MNKCITTSLIIGFLGISNVFSQEVKTVVIGTENILVEPSAILQFATTQHGILIPRMETNKRDLIVNPAEGLMIYNLDSKTIEYFDGTLWRRLY
ncbi:MAG: hypothetical protein ACJAZ3_001600 [Sphingobacteriales bacterium]|jgi:hypothetical protein